MAIEEWTWYTHKGDKSDLPYYANTVQTLKELYDFIIKINNQRKGGFFKRLLQILFRKKMHTYVYDIVLAHNNTYLGISYCLRGITNPLMIRFSTYEPNRIDFEFGLNEEHLNFDADELSVKGMFYFIENMAKYVYQCVTYKRIYNLGIIIDHFLQDLKEVK